jgi:uncharacterized SAM-binding protein YcdF (DUF218 family)
VNDIFSAFGLETWKGLIAALVLPPVPFLLLVLVGARLMFRRRLLAWLLILLAVAGLWLTSTTAFGKLMRMSLLPVPPALGEAGIDALAADARSGPPTAIVVLGGGRRTLAPEYGMSTLSELSMERLRYGLWLGRRTGLPVAFVGGVGWSAHQGISEAEVAERIAEREFGLPLKWAEGRSRDTVENGQYGAAMLIDAGIRRIVLVSHDRHERRAVRAFERGAAHAGQPLVIIPAPVGVWPAYEWELGDWLPSAIGIIDSRYALHEWLGYVFGA